ncbi:restriction endonuclease subunit S [Gelidibacter maritimus]|uniref:Restriction endonuclease subunit S n=1 Tax=Gelidibacter maritimus TaxID=2761487 RepID=A0A7W2R3X0_9FLAO|nr:restriction endonuclease subunit S [Gelidibacter maritimus]MBA6153103.1 restriction endonuclease subunit S [Gelidibacter maritimus]
METKKISPELRFAGFTEDWIQDNAENLCSISTGKSNTQDNIKNGEYDFYVRSATIEKSDKYLFDEEAVLTVGDGVGTGKVYHYVNGKYDLHQRVYRMFDFEKLTAKYFYYYFSENFGKRVLAMTAKSSVDSVRMEMITKMLISFPSEIKEQELISAFLWQLDNLNNNHQTQLTKLKNLKKAMLTKMFPQNGASVPEIRFKGFDGEWKSFQLGNIGSTFTGLSGKTKDDFGKGTAHYIPYTNVFNNEITDKNQLEKIEIDDTQNSVQYGDILFTTSSETPEEVGMSSVWLENDKNVYLNSFCFGYRFKIKVDSHYAAYYMRSQFFRENMKILAQGISRFNISKTKVMEIDILLPSENEQFKIGRYFTNLDELIAGHTMQLKKLNNIKKACLNKLFVS